MTTCTSSLPNTSSQRWDWASTDQAKTLCINYTKKIAQTLLSEKNCCRRAMGPLIALSEIGLRTAFSIAIIAEPLIKGLGNLFGCCFSNKCSFGRGLEYLFLATPLELMKTAGLLGGLPLILPFELIALSTYAAADPDDLKKNYL